MLKSITIRLCLLMGSISIISAQNDISTCAFGVKVYTGPEFFFQPNIFAPMPIAGIRGSFVFNTTELEVGLNYFPKIFQENFDGSSGYKSILYTYHYLLPSFSIHQKLFAKNKHVLSTSFGLSLLLPNKNYADTMLNDGAHSVRSYPTNPRAFILTPQIETSIRYSYVLSKNVAFFTAPYFNVKFGKEFIMPNSPQGALGENHTYIPITNQVSFGLMIGFHFMFHLSKESPSRFFMDTMKKEKTH